MSELILYFYLPIDTGKEKKEVLLDQISIPNSMYDVLRVLNIDNYILHAGPNVKCEEFEEEITDALITYLLNGTEIIKANYNVEGKEVIQSWKFYLNYLSYLTGLVRKYPKAYTYSALPDDKSFGWIRSLE